MIGKKRVQGCENRVNPPFSDNRGQQRKEEGCQTDGDHGALNRHGETIEAPFGDWQGSNRLLWDSDILHQTEERSSLPPSRGVQFARVSTQLTLMCHDTIGRIWKNQHALLVRMNKVSRTEMNWLLQTMRRGAEMNAKLLKAIVLGFLGWPSPRLEASSNEFVVHEWGTFTSIAGIDSQTLEWTPYRGGAELPGFVYGGKHNARGTVRMETPVIYFYTPKELTCTVKVSFPQGEITEYYPMPDRLVYPVKAVQWNGVELLPGRAVNLPLRRARTTTTKRARQSRCRSGSGREMLSTSMKSFFSIAALGRLPCHSRSRSAKTRLRCGRL